MHRFVIAIIPVVALLSACQQPAEQSAQEPVSITQTPPAPAVESLPAPRPFSMRETAVRLKTGAIQAARCNIERADEVLFWPEQPRVTRSKTVEMSGWIIDEGRKSVPGDLRLRLQSANGVAAWEQDVVQRIERKDVAKNLHDDAYAQSGFKVGLDIPDLPPGDYVVYLAYGPTESEAICGLGRRFTLTL